MQKSRMILVVGLGLVTTACGSRAADPVCSFGGATYQQGESFPSSDGCNTCSCDGTGVSCTARGCAGQIPAGSCSYNGKVYKQGDVFPAADGCNSCSCNPEGHIGVGCTAKLCPEDGNTSCPKLRTPAAAGDVLGGKACSGTQHCTYVIEDCVDYPDVEWSCGCNAGAWSCSRGYDCPGWRRDAGTPTQISACKDPPLVGTGCNGSFTSCWTKRADTASMKLEVCSCQKNAITCDAVPVSEGASCASFPAGMMVGPLTCPSPSSPYVDCSCVCTSGTWRCQPSHQAVDAGPHGVDAVPPPVSPDAGV